MNEKDLPRLHDALTDLYRAIHTLCEIEGTLEITNVLVDGTSALEQRIIALEYGAEE